MDKENKNYILEEYDKKFIISLFEIIIQLFFDNYKFELKKIITVNDILRNINQKYNINNFIFNDEKIIYWNLEIFLKNKFNEQKIPIFLINLEYNNLRKDEFQMIDMLYIKYDEKFEHFLCNLLVSIINYLLTFPFIGFNYLKNINSNYLSKLHKYFIFDFNIYSETFENVLTKFNKNSKFFSNEKYNYEYSIDTKEVYIKILNINPNKEEILNFINLVENKKFQTKNRNRVLSSENIKIYNNMKEKRDRKSNNESELKGYTQSNKKKLTLTMAPPFVLQSEELLINYIKKNSITDINSDESINNEEYNLLSFRNRDEFEVSVSKKSKNQNSSKNIERILKENSGSFSLGNDLDSFFSYVKYSKYKLSELFIEYFSKEKENDNNHEEIKFEFDNIYNFENFDEFMENFKN